LNFPGEASISLLADAIVLDDALTLGYPPISGFESVLIADRASINSMYLRSSAGQVIAAESNTGISLNTYLSTQR
jgi:hypothetical protein